MNITQLKIDNRSLGKKLLLVDIIPAYLYKNGVRTDEIEGYRYVIAMPENGFDKLSIKIMGNVRMEKPTDYVEVALEGLELFIYWRAGSYEIGATATNIHAIKAQ